MENVLPLSGWLDQLQTKGRNTFSLEEVRKQFDGDSETAVKRKLNRLTNKGKILPIYKGFYIIISPQYQNKGVIPPVLFLDSLMQYLNRPYYLGLLNAAAFYGAAHQQPQEFFVFTSLPAMRATKKKGLKITYISKTSITDDLLEKRKTETGYLCISSPELTAADLIQFEKKIGGLNRVGTILNDLFETLKPEQIRKNFFKETPVFVLQRLGYICEYVMGNRELADHIYRECQQENLSFFRTPLRKSFKTSGYQTDERWKVIINTTIEID